VELILFNCVGNDEVLHIVKEESNSVHKINRKKYKLVGHSLLVNCLIKHDTALKKDGKLEVTKKDKEDVSNYRMT